MLYRLLFLSLLIAGLSYRYYRNNAGLPPGPPRIPLIGNIHQLPQKDFWKTWQQWSKKYGPIFSLRIGLDTVIVLNNHQVAQDLLDKRSNIYSSRPRLVMAGECVSKGLQTLLMPYGQQWRTHQRLQASFLNVRMSQSYIVLQDVESKQLILELLDTDDFSSRFHRYSCSLVYALAPGGIAHAVTQDDEYMGYRIPAGATVVGNHWAIDLDGAVHKDPLAFNPDRWIEQPDLPLSAFGFGRRVCTGQHIARNSLFVNIARILWTFDIAHKYENGTKQKIDPFALTQRMLSRPMPFKASFTVRSPERRAVVEQTWRTAQKDVDVILESIRTYK